MSLRPVLVFAVSLALFACKSGESSEGSSTKAAQESAPSKPEAEAKAETGADGAETGAGVAETGVGTETGEAPEPLEPLPESFEEVGVEVCDAYVRDYVACIEKAPEAEREAQRRVVFENITAWKQMAEGGPSAEKGLQTACRIAREQAKRATQEWACEW